MLVIKKNIRKRYNGEGIFDVLGSVFSKAVSSSAAQTLGKAAVEGVKKGVETGAQQGSKMAVQRLVDRITKPKTKKVEDTQTRLSEKSRTILGQLATPVPEANVNSVIAGSGQGAVRIEDFVKSVKRGSGIKTVR